MYVSVSYTHRDLVRSYRRKSLWLGIPKKSAEMYKNNRSKAPPLLWKYYSHSIIMKDSLVIRYNKSACSLTTEHLRKLFV